LINPIFPYVKDTEKDLSLIYYAPVFLARRYTKR